MNDDLIAKLKTPEDCEQFAINVEQRGKPELALAARAAGGRTSCRGA